MYDANIILQRVDSKADPCDDFYQYACGGPEGNPRLKQEMENKGDQSRNYFVKTTERVQQDAEALLTMKTSDPIFTKLQQVFSSCVQLESGKMALGQSIEQVTAWIDKEIRWDVKSESSWTPYESEQLSQRMAKMQLYGIGNLFGGMTAMPDMVKGAQTIAAGSEVGGVKVLGLDLPPNYWADDQVTAFVQNAYTQVLFTYEMLGYPIQSRGLKAHEAASLLVELFKSTPGPEFFATIDWQKIPTAKACQDLTGMLSGGPIDWNAYCSALGLKSGDFPILAISFLNSATASVLNRLGPLGTMKLMETVTLVFLAEFIGGAVQRVFSAYRRGLEGRTEPTPANEKCVRFTIDKFPWQMAKQFVIKYFPDDTANKVKALLSGIRDAFLATVEELDWMDGATKKEAKKKAEVMELQVGAPDWIMDQAAMQKRFENLNIAANMPYFEMIAEINRWDTMQALVKIGKDINKKAWAQTPLSASMYYNFLLNRIVFTAGSLQPPFYEPESPAPVQFGSVSYMMGQQLTHAFDSNGAMRDATGALRNWWQKKSLDEFENRQGCFKEQYENIKIKGLTSKINGMLTLSENIADSGGLALAWRAFQKAKIEDPKTNVSLGPLSPDKLFFIGFAQTWCGDSAKGVLDQQ
eukprot:gnl/MRDRNA2_/MRDRNA2_192211_c0_seq1.p1 gnl/MRDRNA2_/MRDRNA2_192211_c0~~gnl/MRDRNA2_/MRDRNA2_192211_c0_seq1.p1  ORF type:complete len:696 (+),score=134.70 gnl/MRDRNA2_/MRDRNA2_192211_c0_seq1:176-2089(+)